jgi:hypothetical protein
VRAEEGEKMRLQITIIAFACIAVCGWIANIYKLATCGLALSEIGMMEVLRVVGIFLPPLGVVLGFF